MATSCGFESHRPHQRLAKERLCQEGSGSNPVWPFRKLRFSQPIYQVLHIFCAFEIGHPSRGRVSPVDSRKVDTRNRTSCGVFARGSVFQCSIISDMPAVMVRQGSSVVQAYHGIRRYALGALRRSVAAEALPVKQAGKGRNKPEQPVLAFV
jgi:hypothetical protein